MFYLPQLSVIQIGIIYRHNVSSQSFNKPLIPFSTIDPLRLMALNV